MATPAYADFFTSQDAARRQTGKLVVLFILGVVATILSMWVVAAGVVAVVLGKSARGELAPRWGEAFSSWQVFVGVVVIVGGVVGIATLVKLVQLSQGGTKIAEMLGGKPIDPDSRLPGHRQILDIVEEMSIASGVPVPPVYLIECDSINAFAAGPDPSNSVIGVTGGLLRHLSRDELQGVIAHEYSHIFHGDTRINARTTAVIAGIMALGVIGYFMFRFIGPQIAQSGSGKNKGGAAGFGLAIIVLGLVIWGIGSLGMLFGRLIQAAISRQREYLADAAAVQYTRNPEGIGGALAKIRDHYGARIASPAAQELNHFLFCSSISSLFATHPPIDDRIQRIVAMGATGVGASEAKRAVVEGARAPARPSAPPPPPPTRGARAAIAGLVGAEAIAGAGSLDARGIAAAHEFTSGISPDLREALATGPGARAVCYAIARRSNGARKADSVVQQQDPEAAPFYARLAESVWHLRGDRQIALADIAAPALFALGLDRYRAFRETLRQVVQSDERTDLREWTLLRSLERRVEARFARAKTPAKGRLEHLQTEMRVVLTIAATASHGAGEPAEEAMRRAGEVLGDHSMPLLDAEWRRLDTLDTALKRLAAIRFADRERLLAAIAVAVAHDGRVSVDEHLIVRGAADALDVPMPALDSAA